MENEKILVLPEFDPGRNKGGGEAVAKMLKSHKKSENLFKFILDDEKNTNDDKGHLNYYKERIMGVSKRHITKHLFAGILGRFINKKSDFKSYEQQIEKHDRILCMKVYLAYHIMRKYPEKEISIVYQGQGSTYYRHTELKNNNQKMLGKFISDRIERSVFKSAKNVIFPSEGTKEALLETNNHLAAIFEDRDYNIVNNGINIQDLEDKEFKEFRDLNKMPEDINNFILTVANINEAKGIERVPNVLTTLNSEEIDYHWVIIGDGCKSDKLKEEIDRLDISEKVTWFRKRYPREEILGLMQESDFFIAYHRYSVFDLAIIEAMFTENIPILSKVGGNKEFNLEKNIMDIEKISRNINVFKNQEAKKEMKELNKDIAKKEFSEKRMFEEYMSLFN
jgi:glycosyltransferase involved in cell wall biosynthesis